MVVVPIGGGGLISGVAARGETDHRHRARVVVGVDVVSCAFQDSVRAGRLVEIDPGASLADGLGGNADPDTITLAIIQQLCRPHRDGERIRIFDTPSRAWSSTSISSPRAPARPPRRRCSERESTTSAIAASSSCSAAATSTARG